VRQGGIMSPVLFHSYIDDLNVCLNNSKIGCIMNVVISNHIMYADDTCIIAPSPTALHTLLGMCFNFAYSNFVKFNESKTECLCFKPKKVYVSGMMLNNEPLPFVSSNKYIGMIVHDKLDDEEDIM